MNYQDRNRYERLDKLTIEQISEFKEEGRIKFLEPFQSLAEKKNISTIKPRTIISEGDSWFDYMPGTDIIDCLRNHHNCLIDNFAKAGDTLENLIYGNEINSNYQRVTPQIKKVLNRLKKLKPKIFLFSGGGNDVAGDELETFLNHKETGFPNFHHDRVDYMIDKVFKKYFIDLIAKVKKASPQTHIIAHGYGHTKATGKGVNILFITWVGPWIKPAFARKGIFDTRTQNRIIRQLIDRYNAMLQNLDDDNSNFHYVDFRKEIDPGKDWANELHLKNSAYARVADIIYDRIVKIG